MTQLQQMLSCPAPPTLIIHCDRIAPVLTRANEHRRHSSGQRPLDSAGLIGMGEENNSSGAVLQQHVHACKLAGGVTFGIAEHRRIASSGGMPLQELGHLAVKWICQVADDYAQDCRSLPNELACQDIRTIAELLDRLDDTGTCAP